MRYVFGFLCVCALCVVPLLGCGETSRDMCEGVSCNDDNECTDDVCNPVTGACEYTPVEDGTACVDGTCLGGICTADETIMEARRIKCFAPLLPHARCGSWEIRTRQPWETISYPLMGIILSTIRSI